MAEKAPPPPPPWGVVLPREQCNFHTGRSAVATYAGTPVCEDCARRLGWPPPSGERAA